ncbi:MAG: CHAT domain-containing protein [Rhizonema sp. NSF051]|nr:CHAT domain-containing protein [Rhizonema sp. NSF051]
MLGSKLNLQICCYQPLVFLNACQSAGGADELRRTFNLPKVFIQHSAAAVIATACPVPDIFAAAFAKVFYKFFLRGMVVTDESGEKIVKMMSIGEALRATRWYFLTEFNNPLGLAYGLSSPAGYRVEQVLTSAVFSSIS